MVSQVYAYLQTHQIVCIKYVQFFVYQVFLNKAVRKKKLQKTGLFYSTNFGKSGNNRNRQEIFLSSCLSRIHPHDFLPCFCRKNKAFQGAREKKCVFQGSVQIIILYIDICIALYILKTTFGGQLISGVKWSKKKQNSELWMFNNFFCKIV